MWYGHTKHDRWPESGVGRPAAQKARLGVPQGTCVWDMGEVFRGTEESVTSKGREKTWWSYLYCEQRDIASKPPMTRCDDVQETM